MLNKTKKLVLDPLRPRKKEKRVGKGVLSSLPTPLLTDEAWPEEQVGKTTEKGESGLSWQESGVTIASEIHAHMHLDYSSLVPNVWSGSGWHRNGVGGGEECWRAAPVQTLSCPWALSVSQTPAHRQDTERMCFLAVQGKWITDGWQKRIFKCSWFVLLFSVGVCHAKGEKLVLFLVRWRVLTFYGEKMDWSFWSACFAIIAQRKKSVPH